MKNLLILIVFWQIVAVIACAHVSTATSPASKSLPIPTEDAQINFWVGSSSDSHMLEGVKVTLVARDGTEMELGRTDIYGNLLVSKTVLREHDVSLVLFSSEHFFTGALRAEHLGLENRTSVERLIHLAAFAIP